MRIKRKPGFVLKVLCNGLLALLLFQLLSCWEQFLGFSLDAVRLLFGVLLSDTHTGSHHTHFPSCATQKITLAKKTQTVSQNILAFVFCVIVSIMFNISTISSIQGGTVVQRLALLSHTAGSVWVGQGRVGGAPMFLQCPYRSCLGAPASSHSGDFKWVVGVNGLSVTHSPGVHQLATSLKWKDGFHPYCHGQKFTSPGGNLLHVLLWDLWLSHGHRWTTLEDFYSMLWYRDTTFAPPMVKLMLLTWPPLLLYWRSSNTAIVFSLFYAVCGFSCLLFLAIYSC